jgi:PD-(D/E)XK nuclease superfamily
MLDPLSVSIPLATAGAVAHDAPVRKLLKRSSEHPDDYVMELDYSTTSTFLECPRKFENYAVRSREADRDQSATNFGGLFHKLEEARMRAGGLVDGVADRQRKMIESHFVKFPPPAADHRTGDRMMQVMKLYNERYGKDGWEKKIFHDSDGPFVERPFKIELATIEVNARVPYPAQLLAATDPLLYGDEIYIHNIHVIYMGRVDLVLEEPPLLWVIDRKTTSRGGREFEEAFRLSLQTRGYAWATQKITGRPVAGALIDAAVIRPLTKTGTGTEFNRVNYFYSPDSIAEWEDDMKAHVSDIVANLVRGFFPQSSRSFMSPCARCDYQENCALPRAQRATDLACDLYRDVRWNPMHDL